MGWNVEYRSSVDKDLSRLPHRIRERVLYAITSLCSDPFPQGCKKLKGQRTSVRYRVRIAQVYRLVYSVFQSERLIRIEFVGHRRDAYRWF
jgi:mRNA interferase RelE/StbE